MKPVIELSDICFAYAGVPVLRHVCGTVEQGEAVGITGPNGAGKSTLLRLLNGLIFPEQGTYRFCGEQITAARLREVRFRKTLPPAARPGLAGSHAPALLRQRAGGTRLRPGPDGQDRAGDRSPRGGRGRALPSGRPPRARALYAVRRREAAESRWPASSR
jgi:energy-coupling factor transporter ATP-binding protein EcfA2